MQENPFSAILGTLRRDADERQSAPWVLGCVMCVSPLIIQYSGLSLTSGDLLVNYQLRTNTQAVTLKQINGKLDASADCSKGSITALNLSGGDLQASGIFGGVLMVGDQVAMLKSDDGQQYVVLCKVVSA